MSECLVEVQCFYVDSLKCDSAKALIKGRRNNSDSVYCSIESFYTGHNAIEMTLILGDENTSEFEELYADAIAVKLRWDSGSGSSYGYVGLKKCSRKKALDWIASHSPEDEIWRAFNNNDMDSFTKLADGVLTEEDYTSALLTSVLNELGPQAKILIDLGANPNMKLSDEKHSALHTALITQGFNSSKVLLTLLDEVDEVVALDVEGNTALHLALKYQISNQDEIVKKLLGLGVNPSLTNKNNETAIVCYTKDILNNSKLPSILKILLEAGWAVKDVFGDVCAISLLDEMVRGVALTLSKQSSSDLSYQKAQLKTLDRLIKSKAIVQKA